MIIYLILNKINGKMYIGKSIKDDIKSTSSRVYSHLNGKRAYSKLVFKDVQKYGKDNFLVIIIHKEDCTVDKLNNLEKYYIKHFNTRSPNGYNLTDGGERGDTFTCMDAEKKLEVVSKRSKSMLGKNKGKNPYYGKTVYELIEISEKRSNSCKISSNKPEDKLRQSEHGKYNTHVRWHINRGIINPNCKFCVENGKQK